MKPGVERSIEPAPYFANEHWSKYNTRDIFLRLPSAFQALFIPVESSYIHRNPEAMVTDWSTPPQEDPVQNPIVTTLPEEFLRGPNLLARTIAKWGHQVSSPLGNGFRESSGLLYSSDNRRSPEVVQIIDRIPDVNTGVIFLPLRRQLLTTPGCFALFMGGVDEEAYKFVCEDPKAAFKLLGKATYDHYLQQYDTALENQRKQMHEISEGLLDASQAEYQVAPGLQGATPFERVRNMRLVPSRS